MAQIKVSGYFSWNESLPCTDECKEGQLLQLNPEIENAVQVVSCTQVPVYGVALTAVDHQLPSSSKVTIIHGPAKFEILGCSDVIESDVMGMPINTPLYASYRGHWTTQHISNSIIGYITKVPTEENKMTMGVLLKC